VFSTLDPAFSTRPRVFHTPGPRTPGSRTPRPRPRVFHRPRDPFYQQLIRIQAEEILLYLSFQLSNCQLFNQWDFMDFYKLSIKKLQKPLTTLASFWMRFTYLWLRQVFGVFSAHLFPALNHFRVLLWSVIFMARGPFPVLRSSCSTIWGSFAGPEQIKHDQTLFGDQTCRCSTDQVTKWYQACLKNYRAQSIHERNLFMNAVVLCSRKDLASKRRHETWWIVFFFLCGKAYVNKDYWK